MWLNGSRVYVILSKLTKKLATLLSNCNIKIRLHIFIENSDDQHLFFNETLQQMNCKYFVPSLVNLDCWIIDCLIRFEWFLLHELDRQVTTYTLVVMQYNTQHFSVTVYYWLLTDLNFVCVCYSRTAKPVDIQVDKSVINSLQSIIQCSAGLKENPLC